MRPSSPNEGRGWRWLLAGMVGGNLLLSMMERYSGDFLAGVHDVPIDTLDMDSLAEMEVCIAIEVNAGVSIVPEQLRKIGTLGRLVALIQAQA